jgi:hypothetical protein
MLSLSPDVRDATCINNASSITNQPSIVTLVSISFTHCATPTCIALCLFGSPTCAASPTPRSRTTRCLLVLVILSLSQTFGTTSATRLRLWIRLPPCNWRSRREWSRRGSVARGGSTKIGRPRTQRSAASPTCRHAAVGELQLLAVRRDYDTV